MFVVDPSSRLGVMPRATKANRREVPWDLPFTEVGDGTIIGLFCAIYAGVAIGPDCRVGDHATIREGTRIGARCVIGTNADVQYDVEIGDDVRIMNGSHITGGTVIGAGSFIGPGVMTANDPHIAHFDLDDYQDRGRVAPVIGRKVFVGVGAILLPGVVIGDGAIIAAGAVVTGDVGPGSVVLGMPARPRVVHAA